MSPLSSASPAQWSNYRDVRVRVHDSQRHVGTMVQAPVRLGGNRLGAREQAADLRRQLRAARRRVLSVVVTLGKAAEVIDERHAVPGGPDRQRRGLPVRRHHEDGPGPRQCLRPSLELDYPERVIHQRRRPVTEVDARHPAGGQAGGGFLGDLPRRAGRHGLVLGRLCAEFLVHRCSLPSSHIMPAWAPGDLLSYLARPGPAAFHDHGNKAGLEKLSHNCRLLICSGVPVHLRQLFDASNGDQLLKTPCSSSLTFQDHELSDSLWSPPKFP